VLNINYRRVANMVAVGTRSARSPARTTLFALGPVLKYN